jgi:formate C-acetyltransferase
MYWLRRRIFDREQLRHRDKPVIVRLAWGLACYLIERDLWFENDLLAGCYQFIEYRHSLPFTFLEAYETYRNDPDIHIDTALIDESIRMQKVGFAGIGSGLHVIGGIERSLKLGIKGMRQVILDSIAKNGETDFLKAGLLVLDAAILYIRRYADEAKMLAVRQDTDPERKQKLIAVAKACDWIATEPPETFHEAIQLITLVHEIFCVEQRCGSLSLGRFDKMLYPYYKKDIEAGSLTPELTQDLIEALWLKLADNRWGWQNVTLGGYDSKSGFCCNEITRMCLSASMKLRRDQPQISFRCHPAMPLDIWDNIISLLRLGLGFPSLFNDEVCIKAKERVGVTPEDAEQYGILGCVEVTIPEKEYSHTEGIRINWPKMLDIALHGGRDIITGLKFAQKEPRTLETFISFEDFLRWFKGEFIYYVDFLARAADEMHTAYARHYPIPFLSATMYGCAEKGRDAADAGTIYNHSCINTAGQANLIDSLAAIKKFVFEEKRFTLNEIEKMIAADFEGYEAERQYILANTPRFGSDAVCTGLMNEMHNLYCDYLVKLPNKRGGVREVGYYSVESQVYFGSATGALPDGRKRGDILANGIAPVQGTEKHGPLRVLQSVASMDTTYLSNGMALDIKFHPHFFDNPEHCEKFREAVEIYFKLGGMQLQCNVIEKDTLLAAQKEPEKYKDLIVRVSGFSAYFNDLSKAVQDEIIKRTEYGV